MVEKSSSSKLLFIYTVQNPSLRSPEIDTENQLDEGVDISIKYDLAPIEYPERGLNRKKRPIGLSLIYLLTRVSTNDVKHIFVRNTNMFCPKDKIILRFILDYLAVKNVFVYDKDGLVSQDYIDVKGLPNNLKHYMKQAGLVCDDFEDITN